MLLIVWYEQKVFLDAQLWNLNIFRSLSRTAHVLALTISFPPLYYCLPQNIKT